MKDMGQIVSRLFEKMLSYIHDQDELYIKIIVLLVVDFLFNISFDYDDLKLDNIILWTGGSKFEGSWVWDNGKEKEMILK